MIKQMMEYLLQCPVFCGSEINVNYLDGMTPAYSVDFSAKNNVIRSYTDGGSLQEKRFVLGMRKEMCASPKRNLAVAEDCEAFAECLEEQNREGNFPETDQGIIPYSVEIVRNFSVVQSASVDARFEAELKFVFCCEG